MNKHPKSFFETSSSFRLCILPGVIPKSYRVCVYSSSKTKMCTCKDEISNLFRYKYVHTFNKQEFKKKNHGASLTHRFSTPLS